MNKNKKIPKMTTEAFAQKVFNGLVNGQSEIVVGISKAAKILSGLAPEFGFNTLNSDEEKLLKNR